MVPLRATGASQKLHQLHFKAPRLLLLVPIGAIVGSMRSRPRPNGTTIEALRLAHGLSNSELARRVGVSRQYMGRIQEGERGASIKVISRIAQVFKVEVSAITRDPS